jgi:hypothetical protein
MPDDNAGGLVMRLSAPGRGAPVLGQRFEDRVHSGVLICNAGGPVRIELDLGLAARTSPFLAAAATMSFSTTLLAAFITYRTAMPVYWINLLLLGLTLYWSWCHAPREGPGQAGT